MNRFYKYLKSFDSIILQYSKPIGQILSLSALLIFIYKISQVNLGDLNINIDGIVSWWGVLGVLLCFGINHSLDAFIWRFILRDNDIHISLKEALIMNWRSLLFAIATPSRIGELPARRIFLNNQDLKLSYKSAGIHYVFKPLTFLMLFVMGFGVVKYGDQISLIYWVIGLIFMIGLVLKKYRLVFKLILLNSLRVFSYCLQHGFILVVLYNIQVSLDSLFVLIITHSSGALIPHIFGTEIFIKSLIYDFVGINKLTWVSFTFSLFLLWCMNIMLPALIALGLKKDDHIH